MSDILSYLSMRENAFRRGGKERLNCNFLLKHFACMPENTFPVRSSSGEGIPPYACQFRKDRCSGDLEILAIASEEGDITLFNSSTLCSKKELHNWNAHQNAILDICWLPDVPKIISAGGDHNVILWDALTCKKIITFSGHTGSVKCISIYPEQSSIFATGARDGAIKIWDSRVQSKNCCSLITKPDITILNYSGSKYKSDISLQRKWKHSVNLQTRKTVTSVAFQNINCLASATCSETSVKLWDLRRTYCEKPKIHPNPKYTLTYKNLSKNLHGSASMVFNSTYKILYVCCTDDCIYALDCHSYMPNAISSFHGFKANTFFVKVSLSVDDKFLLCGSSDEKAYIWNTSQSGFPLVSLIGHSAEVTSVAWHPYDFTTLATCGDDNRVLLWKINNLKYNKCTYTGVAHEIHETSDLKNLCVTENKFHSNMFDTVSRPLKEISLTQFFSNANTLYSKNAFEKQSIENKPYDETQFCQKNNKNYIIKDPSSIIPTNSMTLNIDKENYVKTDFINSIPNFKKGISSKAHLKVPCKHSKPLFANLPASKKRKTGNITSNLITSYFQGL